MEAIIMTSEKNNLLEAEEAANQLLEELIKLKEEIEAYESAKAELNIIRNKLIDFINSTEELAKKTYESAEALAKIGAPNILMSIEDVKKEISGKIDSLSPEIKNNVQESIQNTNSKIEKVNQDIQNGIQEASKKSETLIEYASKSIKNVKLLLMLNIGISIIAIIIAIIGFVR